VAFEPEIVTPLIVNVALPELLRVIDWLLALPTSWLAKTRLDGFSDACGAMPVPASTTAGGPPTAFVVKLKVAVRFPEAPGVNDTRMAQLPPGASAEPH
jgi:hypothetical protein